MTLSFGTDGIRGVANSEVTPELSLALGLAAVSVLSPEVVVVGRDTRQSGDMLAAAMSAGCMSAGADVVDLGTVPTPVVAFEAARRNALGVVISASHNPFGDNGLKIFAQGGKKLSADVESRIEKLLFEVLGDASSVARSGGSTPGRLLRDVEPEREYVQRIRRLFPASFLSGVSIVLDCANGAASGLAPKVLRDFGAELTLIHAEPDGTNINEACGSTHPQDLQRVVTEVGASVGIALDGDADRVLFVDETGRLVDGDHMMAMLAIDAHSRNELPGGTVVVTVMSNLGFMQAMERRGIRTHVTKVGDKYVLDALDENGWTFGGEQSGHVIFRDLSTTGDGLLTALKLLDVTTRSTESIGHLSAGAMTRLPQVLKNVRVKDRSALERADSIWAAVKSAETELAGEGRVLLRPSGTEPLVRVMVEAPTIELANDYCDRLCSMIESELG